MLGTSTGWSVTLGAGGHPGVTITTTKTGWAEFLANRPEARAALAERVRVEGSPEAVAAFVDAMAAFPFGRSRPRLALPEVGDLAPFQP